MIQPFKINPIEIAGFFLKDSFTWINLKHIATYSEEITFEKLSFNHYKK
jgi:hypothetical protein